MSERLQGGATGVPAGPDPPPCVQHSDGPLSEAEWPGQGHFPVLSRGHWLGPTLWT